MVKCDSCDRHVNDLLLKRIWYRIEGSGSAPLCKCLCFLHALQVVQRHLEVSDALLELLSHSSFLCAFFSNTVRPWRLCASLKSRLRHPSYCVRCTFRRVLRHVLQSAQFWPIRTRTRTHDVFTFSHIIIRFSSRFHEPSRYHLNAKLFRFKDQVGSRRSRRRRPDGSSSRLSP